MKKIQLLLFVLCSSVTAFIIPDLSTATTLIAAEAFLDDPSIPEGYGIPLNLEIGVDPVKNATGIINMTGVSPGPHTLYVRFRDDSGSWSPPLGTSINITPGNPSQAFTGGNNRIVAAEAFIDQDPGEGNGIQLSVASDGQIDSSVEVLSKKLSLYSMGMEKGVHLWHTRFLDRTGIWSPAIPVSFYVPVTITQKNSSFWLLVLPAILHGHNGQ